MSQDIEKYRNWARQGQQSRSAAFYYLSKAILEELGEEKGTELIIKTVKEMGKASGQNRKRILENKGLDNNLENYQESAKAFAEMVTFAWESDVKKRTSDEIIRDFSYCPIAAGFKNLGEEGIKIGELFCKYIDDAVVQEYNSDYECVRESSLNLDGFCRLHFKKK
jgi:hypothetical protein